MKSWKELEEDSKRHVEQSKPEFLAIVEILKESGSSMSISEIYDSIDKNYQYKLSQRQARYCLELLEHYKVLNVSLNGNSKKIYSLAESKNLKMHTTPVQLALLIFSVSILIASNKSPYSVVALVTIAVIIVIQEIDYNFFNKERKNFWSIVKKVFR